MNVLRWRLLELIMLAALSFSREVEGQWVDTWKWC